MEGLSLQYRHELSLFRRQYLQLQGRIDYPEAVCLRQEAFQQELYNEVFDESAVEYQPPKRYQLRILKELICRIETGISNWEEEGISDDLVSRLSSLLALPLPSEAVSAQQKSYVTYTLCSLSGQDSLPPTITLLEARNLVSASGTTGLRTWEASLHMGTYLSSSCCKIPVSHKNVLELGAGTGYVSICCAKYLGASHVTVTDGSDVVVADLSTNFYLNNLQDRDLIEAKKLRWGQALGGEQEEWNNGRNIDVVLGADVTYDDSVIPALVATMVDLIELFPEVKILVAATIRNEKTFMTFLESCRNNAFAVENIKFNALPPEKQEGPFYGDGTPIRLCTIRKGANQI